MPRQIDLFPQNLQVNHDPNNQIGVTAAQINHLNDQIPAALLKAETAFINSVLNAIDQATGLDLSAWATELEGLFSGSSNLLSSLTGWITAAYNNWVTTLDNLDQATAKDFSDFLTALQSNASNAQQNWTTVLEDLGLPEQTASSLVSWLLTLLTPNSPLNVLNLWGLLPSGLFGNVPSTAITDTPANLLTNGGFNGAVSVQGNDIWSWDNTVYYLLPGQNASTAGSTKVTANGQTQQLGSNPVSVGNGPTDQVQPGQEVSFSVQALTSGLTGSGTPIQLGVLTNLGPTILSQAMPSAAPTGWTGAPSGAVAASLTANYTVPDDGSVTTVRMLLAVDETATAGAVWFGAAKEQLLGGLIAELQNDFQGNVAAWTTFVQSTMAAFTNDSGNWPQLIADLESAWSTLWTTLTGLAADEVATLQQIVGNLLGLNTSTGLVPQTQVENLVTDLSNAITTGDWTPLLNALFGGSSVESTIQVGAVPTGIPQANIENLVADLGNAITTGDWNPLLQALFGGTSVGSTIQVGAVPGLPTSKITSGTFAQSMISGLTSSLNALLPTSTYQSLVDGIANALGHSGTGHTWTDIETYLGLIPAGNVTNVLGGANLGADVSSVNTSAANMNTWWTQLLSELGITPGGSNGTNVGSSINTTSTNLTNTWSWLFGTTTPSSGQQVQQSSVASNLGLSNLETDLVNVWNNLFGTGASPTEAVPAAAQSVADGVHQAMAGGSATGTSVQPAAIAANLQRIPQSNVIPDTGAGAVAVTFDAVGSSGYATGTATTLTATASHTVGAMANYLVVALQYGSSGSPSSSVSYGGVPMQSLGSTEYDNLGGGQFSYFMELYGLAQPPTGANTISASVTTAFGYTQWLLIDSSSYAGAGAVSPLNKTSGSGTSMSQTVSSAANSMVVQAFATVGTMAISGYNKTQRANYAPLGGVGSLLLGDAPGAASVAFTATASYNNNWGGLAVSLAPSNPGLVGSGMVQYRNSGTTVSGSAGYNNPFPNGFFDTQKYCTPDLSYSTTNNTVTISLAGWYVVSVGAGIASTVAGQSCFTGIYHKSGSNLQFKYGSPVYVNTYGSFWQAVGTWIVYCAPGDTLFPVYYTTTAGSWFTSDGEANTFFEVALASRSLL